MLRGISCLRWHGRGLVNTSSLTFCVLACMGWVWKYMLRNFLRTHNHGMALVNTSWDTFRVLAGIARVWLTHVEKHFVYRLVQGLVNKCWDAFCILAGMGRVTSTYVDMHFLSSPARDIRSTHVDIPFMSPLSWDMFVHPLGYAGMGWDCSTPNELHIVSSLEWDGFGQHMLRCIFCPRWHGKSLVNIC